MRVGELALECLGHDVDHGISDDGSACQGVKHAHEVLETGLRQALLEAGEQEGRKAGGRRR